MASRRIQKKIAGKIRVVKVLLLRRWQNLTFCWRIRFAKVFCKSHYFATFFATVESEIMNLDHALVSTLDQNLDLHYLDNNVTQLRARNGAILGTFTDAVVRYPFNV